MKLKAIKESIDQKIGLTEKAAFLQEVAKFNQYGTAVYRTKGLKEAAAAINNLVQKVEQITLQESDEWFDNVTVKRNMKQLRGTNEQFQRTLQESMTLQSRLESLYEEMGETISRYFEITSDEQENQDTVQG